MSGELEDEVKLLRMCANLNASQLKKLKAQIEETDKNISDQLTGKSYAKRKEEQKELLTKMIGANYEVLKMHNEVTDKILEFSKFLQGYGDRVLAHNKEVNDLINRAKEFEKIRDKTIAAACIEKVGAAAPGNFNPQGGQSTTVAIKHLSPRSRAAEGEAAYENEKRLNQLSEQATLTQHRETVNDYESFYEKFKNSLGKR
uniref:Clindamycin resistance transfer factor btgA n=1 Tax=Steinernema glaseri TaxID=37863 RepID=A0A1I7YL03_9BILA